MEPEDILKEEHPSSSVLPNHNELNRLCLDILKHENISHAYTRFSLESYFSLPTEEEAMADEEAYQERRDVLDVVKRFNEAVPGMNKVATSKKFKIERGGQKPNVN